MGQDSQKRPRPQEEIPEGENLYRAIGSDDLDGSVILPSAIDVQGTSVYRDKFLSRPEETFDFAPAGLTGLAVITKEELPENVENPNVEPKVPENEATWEFFLVDDPFTDEDGRDHLAHAEVRVRRLSDRPDEENVRPKGAMKRLLRKKLADSFRLFQAPKA